MVYGNLAYKYDYTQEKELNKRNTTAPKASAKPVKKANKSLQMSYLGKIMAVITVAISAVFMIIQYVTVTETTSELASVVKTYAFEESVTAQKAFELEQSVDLSKIENEATSRLGMRRPQKHQVVYLDVKQSDTTVKTAGEIEGFSNRVLTLVKNIKSNIVGFFSI